MNLKTFYLTVELSYPEFKERSTRTPQHSRGGYYKNWADQETSHDASKPPQESTQTGENSDNDNGENQGDEEDAPVEEDVRGDGTPLDPALRSVSKGKEKATARDEETPQDDEDDGTPLDPALRALSKGKEKAVAWDEETQDDEDDGTPLDPALRAMSKGNEKETTPPPIHKAKDKQPDLEKESSDQDPEEPEPETVDIQILDLHSSDPIISYRGRVFQGSWAEVIGTEAILTNDNTTTPLLPSLRTLPGNISLLAASSSRLMTTEKIPKPKVPEVDNLAPIKEEWNIRIPPGKDKTGERGDQISFLENLIALKKKRGDEDQVTVYATDGKGKDWDDRRGVDYRPRRKKIGEEDAGEKRKKKVGRPRGTRSLATRLEGYPVGFGEGAKEPVELSTMTPSQWVELDRGDDDDGGGDGDANGSQEDEDDDEEDDVTMTG